MNMITSWFNSQLMYSLGWTLLHSLWQAALIAIALAATLYITRRGSANSRYLLGLSALMLLVACSVATFAHYYQSIGEVIARSQASGAPSEQMPVLMSSLPWLVRLTIFLNQYMPQIVFTWLAGFALFFTRYCGAWYYCHRIKTALSSKAPAIWQERISTLAHKIGVSQSVQLKLCSRVSVPCVIGHLKPVVLLPVALLTQLSQAEVEAILLHELGHIRRHDYVVGLIQSFIKTLYFFNFPALWICAQIDRERENACDDIAANTCEDRVFYAHTLKNFSDISFKGGLAMAANGNNQHLLQRIQRLFESSSVKSRPTEGMFASALMIVAGLLLSIQAQTASADKLYPEIETLDDASVRSLMDEYLGQFVSGKQIRYTTSIDYLSDFEALTEAERKAFVNYLKADIWNRDFADAERASQWQHLNDQQWFEIRQSWLDYHYSHFLEYLVGAQELRETYTVSVGGESEPLQITIFEGERLEASLPLQTLKAILNGDITNLRVNEALVTTTKEGDMVLAVALVDNVSTEDLANPVTREKLDVKAHHHPISNEKGDKVTFYLDDRMYQTVISSQAMQAATDQSFSGVGNSAGGAQLINASIFELAYEPEAYYKVYENAAKFIPEDRIQFTGEAAGDGPALEKKFAELPQSTAEVIYSDEENERSTLAMGLQRGRALGEGEKRTTKVLLRRFQIKKLLEALEETGAPPEWLAMTKKHGQHEVIENHSWVTIRAPELPENTQVFDLELQEQPLREVVASVAKNQCTQTAFPPSYSQMEKPITIYGYDLTCDKALEVFEALSTEQTAQADQ